MKDIATPSQTRSILKKHNLNIKKSLGQNFIIDLNVLHHIVEAAELNSHMGVIEVGPGLGSLTEQLAKHTSKVLAYELDKRLIPILKENLAAYPHIHILQQDILKANLTEDITTHFTQGQPIAIVANLPYYITTPILFHFIESGIHFSNMVVLLQKEVAQRIVAEPGTKDYGSLSIAVQYYTQPSIVRMVPKTVFIPQPNVDSAVLRLTKREQPIVSVEDELFFFRVVRACFAQRRKIILNNLLHHFGSQDENKRTVLDVLESCAIDSKRRGETLTISEFAQLSDGLYQRLFK